MNDTQELNVGVPDAAHAAEKPLPQSKQVQPSQPDGATPSIESAIDAAFEDPDGISNFIDGLLVELQSTFDGMSNEILSRVTEMTEKISNIERSLTELLQQASDALDASQSTAAPGESESKS